MPDQPAKDSWDKAAIISGFVSSVVIAAVGLSINFSVEQAQRASAEQNAKAQIQQAKQIADGQRKVQEGALTAQLVEHLASTDTVRRRIAIVALQSAVPADTYQKVISIVVTTDPSPEVRIAAIRQAGTLVDPGEEVTRSILAAAKDSEKQSAEREVATRVSDQIEDSRINALKPEAADLARKLIQQARAQNIELRVIGGYRSPEEQRQLLERRPPVTNARWSTHNTGLAFDVGIFEAGKYVSDMSRYRAVGELGKQLGLVWGGDSPGFADTPHFETKDARSELAKLRQQAGG